MKYNSIITIALYIVVCGFLLCAPSFALTLSLQAPAASQSATPAPTDNPTPTQPPAPTAFPTPVIPSPPEIPVFEMPVIVTPIFEENAETPTPTPTEEPSPTPTPTRTPPQRVSDDIYRRFIVPPIAFFTHTPETEFYKNNSVSPVLNTALMLSSCIFTAAGVILLQPVIRKSNRLRQLKQFGTIFKNV